MLEDQELEVAELEELETLIRRYRKSKQSPDRRLIVTGEVIKDMFVDTNLSLSVHG